MLNDIAVKKTICKIGQIGHADFIRLLEEYVYMYTCEFLFHYIAISVKHENIKWNSILNFQMT